ncbi:histidine kinase [Bradyrhizobium hipponense]|uniref:Histidine kinase n=1 Tax=Bradyrhizobium hipponense TaxID=2605638 RepID=A0A5S4YXE9_9BRAD|nr:histidine kinase [Bradyrhizobium hipponense]
MYSYHNVAKLRQFRGAYTGTSTGIHRPAGTVFHRCGLPSMERFFLAMMICAVLLLIVAADLLVNGPALHQASVDMAYVLPP